VVAGDIGYLSAAFHQRQKTPQNIVVLLWPVDTVGAHAPAVNDIANQIQLVTAVMFEKVDQAIGLAAFGAQVNVGKKNRAVVSLGGIGIEVDILFYAHLHLSWWFGQN
jgi:hypothetical protein